MSNPDILFRGIPRSKTRGYTARVLGAVKPRKVVIPCTGSFSLAWVAREAGVSADSIVCGDISLYSTALGNAIMDSDWRLEIKPNTPQEYADIMTPLMTTPLDKAVGVLLMVRILQYVRKDKKAYHEHRRMELVRNSSVYIAQLREQVIEMRSYLQGLTYLPQDMWVTMENELGSADIVGLINPPRYTGGYSRMFAGIDDIFSWDEPSAKQFTEKDYPTLMDMLAEDEALSLMYYATDGEDPSPQWGSPWRSVFADRPNSMGQAAINWIIANRDPVGVEASRGKIVASGAKFPLFTGDISDKTAIKALRVEKQVGDYYRDLFIHRLPGSVTEMYIALIADGFLMGIIGLHLADLRRGKVVKKGDKVLEHCASVTFAFTAEHPRYDRLHKLTLMSITSEWFWDDVLGKENWYELNGAPKHVKTTMLTHHPEVKSARGIFKLDTREQQKDGTYKLTYSTATNRRNREETLREWLKKFADVQKDGK